MIISCGLRGTTSSLGAAQRTYPLRVYGHRVEHRRPALRSSFRGLGCSSGISMYNQFIASRASLELSSPCWFLTGRCTG